MKSGEQAEEEYRKERERLEDSRVGRVRFLEKLNPRATLRSAAVLGGIAGGLLGLCLWFQDHLPLYSLFFTIPFMVVAGAISGWAIEWQLFDDVEEH
jgi:hypothetical protein